MNDTNKPTLTEEKQFEDVKAVHKKPDELSGLNIEARMKIFDPESGEVIIEGRA